MSNDATPSMPNGECHQASCVINVASVHCLQWVDDRKGSGVKTAKGLAVMLPELTLETSKVCAKGPKTKESIQLSSGPESIVRLCQIQSKAFDHLNFRYLSDIFKSFDII